MKYGTFEEKFNDLSIGERIAIFNAYCSEHGDPDNEIHDFDDMFFETYFSNPIEAARATFFGDIQSWNDPYIRFNGYGNLESLSEYNAINEIDDYLEEIFEHPDAWEDYIEDEDDDDEYVCPHCGHVFEQGEWDYNYDTALLDFKCPECDWEGNENELETED